MGILAKIFGGDIAGGIAKLIGQFHLDPAKQAEMQKAVMDNAQEVERWAHELEVKAMDNEIRALETVNQTMREEAKSEHWIQWSWRPLVGFTLSAVLVNNYILLPYFRKLGLLPIEIPGDVWTVMLVVLGISAGTRGWKQIKEAEKK